jgi:hypothetical protein
MVELQVVVVDWREEKELRLPNIYGMMSEAKPAPAPAAVLLMSLHPKLYLFPSHPQPYQFKLN